MALMAFPSTSLGFCRSLSSSSASNSCLNPSSSSSSSSSSFSSPSISAYPSVFCGRGDKRTAKGKRFRHSYGNSRPKDPSKGRGLPAVPLPPRPPKKDPYEAVASEASKVST